MESTTTRLQADISDLATGLTAARQADVMVGVHGANLVRHAGQVGLGAEATCPARNTHKRM